MVTNGHCGVTAPGGMRCRVCGQPLFETPLLRYENMPRAAQNLPDAAALAGERGSDAVVCQCSGCGLIQLAGEPVPYYREVIRASAFSPDMREFRIQQFTRFMDRFSLRGRKVLEAGCGRGEYLSLLKQCGMDAHGLEDAPDAVAYCVRSGLQVTRGFVDSPDYRVAGAPFEAYFILNFLEHLPDPVGTLRGIRANLTETGVGLVEVPNFDMMRRSALYAEFIADHLFYFTSDTLRTALRLGGFDVLDFSEERSSYILSAAVRKSQPSDLSVFRECQDRLQADLDAYIGRFPPRTVAVWGAGHQALALLALARLGERIRYVVDSAPFKQGKFTPATHIPIVAPSALVEDPVQAVIVVAASFSGEVVQTLRQRFPQVKHVAVMNGTRLEPA